MITSTDTDDFTRRLSSLLVSQRERRFRDWCDRNDNEIWFLYENCGTTVNYERFTRELYERYGFRD